MNTILVVIILLLLFGGGGYYAHGRYGNVGIGGVLSLILTVVIVLWILGFLDRIIAG